MKNPSIALIGCGRIGFLLESDPLRRKPCTHFGGVGAAGLRITHACDINAERLGLFAATAGIPRGNTCSSYERLLESVRPSVVIISTWTESHADIGIAAARSGARIIVCEKPLCHDLRRAAALLRECGKRGVRLIVNHERRYDGRYRAAKRIIDRGVLGEIKTVYGSVLGSGYRGSSRAAEGGGPLLHDGTHMIDLIRFFFGEIRSVQGEFWRAGRDRGYEDRAMAWIKTRSGIDIIVEAGGERNYFVFEMVISGTRGKLVIGNGYEKLYGARKSRFYTGFNDLASMPFPRASGMNCFTAEYREVRRLLRSESGEITSGGLDGFRALEAVHAIYYSAHHGKKKVELPLRPSIIKLEEIFDLEK
jgi:predicted dehydrogenase